VLNQQCPLNKSHKPELFHVWTINIPTKKCLFLRWRWSFVRGTHQNNKKKKTIKNSFYDWILYINKLYPTSNSTIKTKTNTQHTEIGQPPCTLQDSGITILYSTFRPDHLSWEHFFPVYQILICFFFFAYILFLFREGIFIYIYIYKAVGNPAICSFDFFFFGWVMSNV